MSIPADRSDPREIALSAIDAHDFYTRSPRSPSDWKGVARSLAQDLGNAGRELLAALDRADRLTRLEDVLEAIAQSDAPADVGASHFTDGEKFEWCVRQARSALAVPVDEGDDKA